MAQSARISSSVLVVKELFELSLNPWVLPFTILLAVCCLYWLLALLGTIDMDSVDFAFDSDIDADVGNSGGLFTSFLKLVNATDVPFMLVFSVVILCKWLINIAAILYWNPEGIVWLGLTTWVVGFIVSCLLAAVLTKPLVPVFKAFKAGEDNEEPILGQPATVVTANLTEKFGQVRVLRQSGAAALVNCRLASGQVELKKGDDVTIITKDEKDGVYICKQISNKNNEIT